MDASSLTQDAASLISDNSIGEGPLGAMPSRSGVQLCSKDAGGGLWVSGASTLSSLRVQKNSATLGGGIAFCGAGGSTLTGSLLTDNEAWAGAGLFALGGAPDASLGVKGTVVASNTAARYRPPSPTRGRDQGVCVCA